jgi:PPM family protein phosphatase
MRIVWEYGLSTHVGQVKQVNEDRSFFRYSKHNKIQNYAIALIADGMGGYQAGDKASEYAVSKIKEWWDINSAQIENGSLTLSKSIESIKGTFITINQELINMSHDEGVMGGTTLSVILFFEESYGICHVGDSRIYKLTTKRIEQNQKVKLGEEYAITQPLGEGMMLTQPLNGEKTMQTQPLSDDDGEISTFLSINTGLINDRFIQLTEDHSWVETEIRKGNLTREEARVHPRRNVLLQCLGIEQSLDILVNEGYINEGDIFLLCSDGFYSLFADSSICNLVLSRINKNIDLQTISDELVELANQQIGATDNISLMLLRRMKFDRKGIMEFLSNFIKV